MSWYFAYKCVFYWKEENVFAGYIRRFLMLVDLGSLNRYLVSLCSHCAPPITHYYYKHFENQNEFMKNLKTSSMTGNK